VTADEPPAPTAVQVVDLALDRYIRLMEARGIDPQGVAAVTLAKLVGLSVDGLGPLLQRYRRAQRRDGATRYVIGAHQYGPRARWAILAKPDSDPALVREARRAQAVWVVHDAVRRLTTDGVLEVRPGLRNTSSDRLIDAVQRATEQMLTSQFDLVQQLLDANVSDNEPEPAA